MTGPKTGGRSPYLQLAREFGVSINYVTGIVQRNGLCRKRGRGSPAWPGKEAQKQQFGS
jgi:hypothetical protein